MNIFLLVILNLSIINAKSYRQENDDEDFIDIGVRLTGNNRDYLIADLIAEEKDIINAGHVSRRMELILRRKRVCFLD
jgi:hypothetical protein